MRLNFQAYAEDIAEISNAATMELNIENGLKVIRDVWKTTCYEMQHHKGDMYRVKNVEDVMQVCLCVFNIHTYKKLVSFLKLCVIWRNIHHALKNK